MKLTSLGFEDWENGEALFAKDLNNAFEESENIINNIKYPPIVVIIAWHKNLAGTPDLPEGWVECNGQTIDDSDSPYNTQIIPNLNGGNRFLRPNSVSGGLGGSSSHKHFVSSGSRIWFPGNNLQFSTVTILPPYINMVWVMRIK